MSWLRRLRDLSLRAKIGLTVGGTLVALLGLSTYFTFDYWQGQALDAARHQALLAARTVRASVEAGLTFDRVDEAHRNLRRLVDQASLSRARVYGGDGTILLSAESAEEGRRATGIWIPDPTEIPSSGLARIAPEGDAVRAYLPVGAPHAAVFEVEFSVEHVKAAMERGARLGIGLVVASVLALAVVVLTMLEREVVSPIENLESMLAGGETEEASPRRGEDELEHIASSVEHLLEKEREVEQLAEARHRRLAEQEGLVQMGELAAEMAHELKRPLVTVRTAVDLLEQEYRMDEQGEEVMGRVDEQLDRLSDTLGDLFSLAHPVELEGETVDLRTVADEALMQIRGHPELKEIELERHYEDDVAAIRGDADRVEQAVSNLVINAAEAIDGAGLVTVSVRRRGEGWVELAVSDTGSGMPEEELSEVTRPFYSTKPRGTGLGLALVTRVVSAHGGKMGIDSTVGEGTTVRLWLPAREPAPQRVGA